MTAAYARLCALPLGIRVALALLAGPWVLAYIALVLRWTGVVAFWMPVQ